MAWRAVLPGYQCSTASVLCSCMDDDPAIGLLALPDEDFSQRHLLALLLA
jgi:hypothetical protein